jgi:hypothetical protein
MPRTVSKLKGENVFSRTTRAQTVCQPSCSPCPIYQPFPYYDVAHARSYSASTVSGSDLATLTVNKAGKLRSDGQNSMVMLRGAQIKWRKKLA